ncbi:XRE family transcriptional regulator, partial [Klebsiella oxytoca]
MYIKLTLQEKLKDERTSRHMTLAELEKATGIARATLGKYESDKCTDISPF